MSCLSICGAHNHAVCLNCGSGFAPSSQSWGDELTPFRNRQKNNLPGKGHACFNELCWACNHHSVNIQPTSGQCKLGMLCRGEDCCVPRVVQVPLQGNANTQQDLQEGRKCAYVKTGVRAAPMQNLLPSCHSLGRRSTEIACLLAGLGDETNIYLMSGRSSPAREESLKHTAAQDCGKNVPT